MGGIITERLSFELFNAEIADEIWPHMTANVARYMRWKSPQNAEEFKMIWQNWPQRMADGESCFWIARLRRDCSFAGLFVVFDYSSHHPRLGLWLREDLHGQGYATEALRGVMAYTCVAGACEYFIYPVAEPNEASRALVEKLGGKIVGAEMEEKYRVIIYHIPAQKNPA